MERNAASIAGSRAAAGAAIELHKIHQPRPMGPSWMNCVACLTSVEHQTAGRVAMIAAGASEEEAAKRFPIKGS